MARAGIARHRRAHRLSFSSCRYRGKRPWFVCPMAECGRAVAVFYLSDLRFLCRHCHSLAMEVSERAELNAHAAPGSLREHESICSTTRYLVSRDSSWAVQNVTQALGGSRRRFLQAGHFGPFPLLRHDFGPRQVISPWPLMVRDRLAICFWA